MALAHGRVSDTFTTTGQSDHVRCRRAAISVSFASTGIVKLRRRLDNSNWRTVVTKTASEEFVYDGGVVADIDLDCTDATGNITYVIDPEPEANIAPR